MTPRAILRVEDQEGNVLLGDEPVEQPQVVDPRIAYLITDILADQKAREPAFGANNALILPFPAAGKTGTTNDYRDNWTLGYTPDLVVGVWIGNNDNSPMSGIAGSRSAAPIWHDFMVAALEGTERPGFVRPEGIVEVAVCPVSGQKHTDLCPEAHTDLFLAEKTPVDCTVHVRVRIDRASGKLATDYCPAENIEERVVYDYGAQWDAWASAQGLAVPPRETCNLHAAPNQLALKSPASPAKDVIQIVGTANVPNLAYYIVEYGVGSDPQGWGAVTPQIASTVTDGVLCTWDTRNVDDGDYTLRLRVVDTGGAQVEARVFITIQNEAPTATPTETLAATLTPTATETLAPTATPTLTVEPTAIGPTPSLVAPTILPPIETSTATPTPTPTLIITPEAPFVPDGLID